MKQNIAIITGASSGIGEMFARQLAQNTKNPSIRLLPKIDELWLIARRLDKLDSLSEALSSHGLTVKTFGYDLLEAESLHKIASLLTDKNLAILVNNAGYGTYGDFTEIDLEWQLGQIALNCGALTKSCGVFADFLSRGSIVINVASLAGFAPMGGFSVYAASKAYALNFSLGIASEWCKKGIKVCALCPGSVQSEFALVASAGARKEVKHGWSAEATVRAALKDACKGKWISVPKFSWRVKRFAGWLFGPIISAKFAERFMRRPSAMKIKKD